MEDVVIYGTGSPILVDIEESLRRSGIAIRAGVKNRDGDSFLSDGTLEIAPDTLDDAIRGLPFVVPLFTPANRQTAAREAKARGFSRPLALIDATVAPPRDCRFGPGSYVNAGAVLGAASAFEAFVFINRGVGIGHHARFGPFVSIGPGVVIAGQVTIGKGAMIGAGAVVLPKITIGDNAVIGAGSVVTRDVPAHCLALGNPARIVKTGIAGYDGKTVD
ncbi:MAG: acetyltransferase [Xanthobacteraceae bacterium]|nr:MAG: acetyltransferase [Xanthobacteraceae bacterium]